MIRVGFDHPFRPLAWMEGQDAHGILIERVRQILVNAGWPPTFHPYTSYEEALRMVARGEAQAAALNLHVGRQWVLDLHLPIALPRRPIMDVDMAIATRFELADSLLPAINKAILPFELLHYGHGPAQAV